LCTSFDRRERSRNGRSARLLQDAMKAHQARRFAEARALDERALARRPLDPDALHYCGVLRHNLGDSAAGVAPIERSLEVAPNNVHAWPNLGNIRLELGHMRRTI
jgi:hypothetical protein